LASSLASHAFGAEGARIKYAIGSSKTTRAVLQLAKEPASLASFNANYSDQGLFGFHVIANKQDVGNVRTNTSKPFFIHLFKKYVNINQNVSIGC
jgi:hypothetical protein